MRKKRSIAFKAGVSVAAAVIIALVVEILVFNWASVESLSFTQVEPASSKAYDSNGYHCVEYSFEDEKVESVDITSDLPSDFKGYSTCSIYVIDEGSSVFYKIADWPLEEKAAYRIHPTGKVSKVLVAACPVTPSAVTQAGTQEAYLSQKNKGELVANGLEGEKGQDDAFLSDIANAKTEAKELSSGAVLDGSSDVAGVKIDESGNVSVLSSLPVGLPSDYDADVYGERALLSTAGDNILEPGEFYADYSLKFNTPIPLDVSKKRCLLLFGILALVFALRPGSSLYRKNYRSMYFFAAIFAAMILVSMIAIVSHYGHVESGAMNQRQYIELAKALAHGQLYVDFQPSSSLLAMDNPYDTNARYENNVEYLWDYSFFNGHYYVYFGILPALIYQLPFYLITGGELPVVISVAISVALLCLGLVFLLAKICDRWFRELSQAMFLILLLVLACGSWVVYACAEPTHYSLPIVTGLACLVWGLAFWVDATKSNKICIRKAVCGSVFVGLTLACRPQLLAGGLLGIVLLAGCYRRVSKKDFIKSAILALIPFVVIFLLVGAYNAARFGSPLDFGANYNLTTNDMTHRAFSLDRLPLAFFAYLFQTPSLIFTYPYLVGTSLASDYYGLTISETMWGGMFLLTPVLLCGFMLITKRFRGRMPSVPLALSVCSLVIGFILVAFDANGAGILMRYFMDFGIFFSIAAVFCIACIWKIEGENDAIAVMEDEKMRFRSSALLLLILAFASVLLEGLWLLN